MRTIGFVRWRGGRADTWIDVPRRTYATTLMAEWRQQGKSIAEIVAGLNERQLFTIRGNPWTANAVHARLQRLRRGSGAKGSGLNNA